MEGTIITQGISLDELLKAVRTIIREELRQAETEKIKGISKEEARRQLGGIHFNTLKSLMEKEGITEWNQSLIETIKLKYPKYNK